jgi:8-hydroxy-5-deazaflavin:NADPH oxidoreductase
MRVAVLGGTGPFGRALAARLVEAGDDVVIGSREAERAAEVAAEIGCEGVRNESAVGSADVIVLAVTAGAAVETARSLSQLLRSPLLSVASELEFADGTARPVAATRSVAERVSQSVEVPVVAGLHSVAAGKLVRERPDEDALVCGNDQGAKQLALELAGRIVAGRAIDVGPLQVARALEGMTAAILNVNRRYKAHVGLRVTGLA